MSQTLFTGENINFPDICWKGYMAGCNQSRRLLEAVKGNFLIKIMDWPTKDEAQLDFLFNNREDVVGNIIINVNIGCSNHELVEIKNLKGVRKVRK